MIKAVFSLLLLLIVQTPLKADTFSIAAYPWEPFLDSEREDGGISLNIIREALARKGHDIDILHVPWVRALAMIKKNKVDILPAVWYSDERAQVMQYSQSYAENRIVFIKAKNNPYEFKGLDSLHNKVVGIARDYAYEEAFLNDKNIDFSIANTLESNVKKVISGRVELTLDDEIVAKAIIPSDLLKKISFTNNALTAQKLFITCNKENPKCNRIINDFNAGLEMMRNDGSLDAMINSIH